MQGYVEPKYFSKFVEETMRLPNTNNSKESLVYGYGTPQKANLVSKKRGLTDIHAKQAALVAAGYNLGKSGINKDGVDGAWGNKSKAAWDQAM